MPGYMLQLNFTLTIPVDEYERMVTPVAHAVAAVDGLRWKIWIVNAAESQAGGFYHFDSEAAADAYLAGPIVTALRRAIRARLDREAIRISRRSDDDHARPGRRQRAGEHPQRDHRRHVACGAFANGPRHGDAAAGVTVNERRA